MMAHGEICSSNNQKTSKKITQSFFDEKTYLIELVGDVAYLN